MSNENLPVLVLNQDYTPITVFPLHTIAARRAVRAIFNGYVQIVAEYDIPIETQHLEMNWPSIVVKNEYVKRTRVAILNAEALWYRDGKICAYCSKNITRLNDITMDHVIPQCRGGRTTWDNVVLSCEKCNQTKGDSEATGKWRLNKKPWKPSYFELVGIRKKYPITLAHESWKTFLGNWDAEVLVR